MNKLSTGEDATLGAYRRMTLAVFGEGPALAFLDKKISEDPDGEDAEVIADERQMVYLLATLAKEGS